MHFSHPANQSAEPLVCAEKILPHTKLKTFERINFHRPVVRSERINGSLDHSRILPPAAAMALVWSTLFSPPKTLGYIPKRHS
jgi:hypothetical protein